MEQEQAEGTLKTSTEIPLLGWQESKVSRRWKVNFCTQEDLKHGGKSLQDDFRPDFHRHDSNRSRCPGTMTRHSP